MTSREPRRDIENLPDDLDSSDGDTVQFWEQKQRELVTSVVDYNLSSLVDLIQDNSIDLSPDYQRRFRWDATRQSRLIESFLMNVPIPPIFLNEDSYGKYSIIDGKQRLSAVHEFLRGRLKLSGLQVFSDINGFSYDDLPPTLQRVINTRPTMRAVIILRQSDADVKFEVFQRLNTGGVSLNPQEIRNSAFSGPFNDLLVELSGADAFHRMLGIKQKDRSAIYREMRDVEFVLRYFTFRDIWDSFAGGMRRYMDHYMAEHRNMTAEARDSAKTDFLSTIDVVEAAFGNHAFRRWLPEKNNWKSQILASLFDAQMFGCAGLDHQKILRHQDRINDEFKRLFSDYEFLRAINAATNTPSYFKVRVKMVRRLITDVIECE